MRPMTTTIDRDPFARASLERKTIPAEDRQSCAWCGSRPGRFAYVWRGDTDYSRWFPDQGFCSVSCWRDYHGA